jgi:transketolase
MRTAFIETLVAEAANDPSLFLLNGDLGYSVLEAFAEKFPDRYVNVGVAEQNMIGVAAGLAMTGKNVFVYSIANFATLRCLEQIRNDVCYHNANVTVVGVGGGLSYGTQGYTHHAVEDIAVTRALPNIAVLCPGDPAETRWATRALAQRKGPGYLRLGKAGEPKVHAVPVEGLEIGKALRLKDGAAVTLISTGNMLETAMQAARLLEKDGISAGVISMPSVKPLDGEFLRAEAAKTRLIGVLEEHVRHGGLAEAVALHLAEIPRPVARILSFCVNDTIASGLVGSQQQLRELMEIDAASVARRVAQALTA